MIKSIITKVQGYRRKRLEANLESAAEEQIHGDVVEEELLIQSVTTTCIPKSLNSNTLLLSMLRIYPEGLECSINIFYMACAFRYRNIDHFPEVILERKNPKLMVLQILDTCPRLSMLKRVINRKTLKRKSEPNQEIKLQDMLQKYHPSLYDLLCWIVKSHKSWRFAIVKNKLLDAKFHYQIQSEPSDTFQALKLKYGSQLGWHGSPYYCWHPILIEGLKNMTNTKYQLHGSIMGPGINLSKNSGMAYAYVSYTPTWKNSKWCICCLNSLSVGIMALCETINLPSYERKNAFVIPENDHVRIRYLCVFCSSQFHKPVDASMIQLE